ncbi:MAG: indole-3-glycerol phosphate synthase TrpC [Candidatus Pacebacteria bacterium]|nr:indole-3-glycerol phosphate synthase TrpC [Candidatus Paceibacterota bacterium]
MSPQTILDEIVARTREDVAMRRSRLPEESLSLRAAGMVRPRNFRDALAGEGGSEVRILAELKQASPSKGTIRKDFHVIDLARELQDAGAAALSVLTEPHYFNGSLRNLRLVSDNSHVPVLRKDFIVSTYQVFEARVFGADAILLIAAALSPHEFVRLKQAADETGLHVLAEVHNEDELETVLTAGVRIVGVNSRDLKTFKTDLKRTEELLGRIPSGIVKVAESGIQKADDVTRLRSAGADACLIGEGLMRVKSPARKLREFLIHAEALEGAAV